MKFEKDDFKKPIQVYFNKVEWDMLGELLEMTEANTLPNVLRAALIKYYVLSKEKKEVAEK